MKDQTRIMPHSLEIEESILASIILFNDNPEIFDSVQPEDFYREQHQDVYRACVKLKNRKRAIDIQTVSDAVKNASLGASITSAPVSTSVADHIQILLEKSALRRMIRRANDVMNACFSANGNAVQVIDESQRVILGVEVRGSKSTFTGMEDLASQAHERYETMMSGNMDGIKTGIADLDKITGGFSRSKLIVIAARPGIGKTAMMLTCARHMAERCKRRVGIFSIEMDKEELVDRLVAMESGVNLLTLSTFGPQERHWERIQSTLSRQSQWPIVIDDTGGLQISELKRRARLMVKNGIEIIFIDQLSKISVPKQMKDYERYTYIVDEIGSLKKELRIPIVLLCQINRTSEEQKSKKPELHHLKSTGRIEEEADIVLLLHRQHMIYDPKNPDTGTAEIIIAKHRGGPCRKVGLFWDGSRTVFYDATGG